MDVRVTVGRSGAVTRVSVSGNGVGDLKSCIETAVRRWRFPSAGASTQTQFPLVFQPGS
jgi:outer membrane biosynthesis protein TonB